MEVYRREWERNGSNEVTTISVSLSGDGSLTITRTDIGEEVISLYGDDDAERILTIPVRDHSKLAFSLLAEKLADGPEALRALEALCRGSGVTIETEIW